MKKIIFLILALAQVFIVYSQETSGTRVTAPIVPNDSSDVYPTHDAYFGRDGYRSVSTLAERDSIKAGYRKAGMLVYVQADSSYYQLRNGLDNNNWWKPIPIVDTTAEWVPRTIYVSMIDDPQTPGDDVDGNGSISLPFATLEKALSTIKTNGIFAPVTVQLDSGSFSWTPRCRAYVTRIQSKIIPNASVAYYFTIKGQFVKETSYPALTWTAKTMPMAFSVTGTTFTTDELAEKFCGNTGGTFFLPIESNRNDTVYVPTTLIGSNTFIYRSNTTLALTSDSYDIAFAVGNPNICFSNLKITASTAHYLMGITALYCTFDMTGSVFLSMVNADIRYSKIKSDPNTSLYAIIATNGTNILLQSVIYRKTNRKTLGNGFYYSGTVFSSALIVSGYLYGISYSQSMNIPGRLNPSEFLFKDCGNAYANNVNTAAIIQHDNSKTGLLFTDYLFYTFSATTPVRFSTASYVTNKLVSIYNPSSLYKSFVREDLGGYINGLGLYTEVQRKLSATLVNNTTDSISIADKTYNRTIELKYTALRGSTYRKGTLEVINTGSGLVFNPGSYFPVTDIGLTFTGAYYSGSSNIIKLKYTVDNSGGNVTLTYDAFRQNY